MNTRRISVVGMAVLAAAVCGVMAFAQTGSTPEKNVARLEHDEMFQSCAKACSDCQRACDSCATHCTHMLHAGKKDHLTTAMSCRDCASVCTAAAQIVSRGGPHSALICECCAKACDQCATACEKFPNDKHMQACAAECRKCEKECQAMLKQSA